MKPPASRSIGPGLPACFGVFCLLTMPGLADGLALRVTADRVNLRAAAGTQYEVVGQVSTGQALDALAPIEGEWVQVVPPETVDLWIYADLVDEGRVIVTRAQVRAGAGLNYQVVGRLERGARLDIRGRLGDWLRIAPPTGSSLWIAREFVQPISDVAPEPQAMPVSPLPSAPAPPSAPPAVTPAPAPPQPETSREPPPPLPHPPDQPDPATPPPLPQPAYPQAGRPADLRPQVKAPAALDRFALVQEQQQGETGRFTGVLRRSGWAFRRPSRYRLITYDRSGRAVTQCYIIEREAQLNQLVGHRIDLTGRTYWVSGIGYPVVAVERLVRIE